MSVRAFALLLVACAAPPEASQGPRVFDVALTPSVATVNTTFQASATGFDPMGGPVKLVYAWEVDGQVVQRGSGQVLAGSFTKGQTVRVVVEPSVEQRLGEPVASAAVRVDNSAPEVPSLVITPPVARAWMSDLVCRPFSEVVDPDGDALDWSLSWTVDGQPFTEGLGTIVLPGDTVPASNLREGQVWRCSGLLSDGEVDLTPRPAARTVEVGVPPLLGVPVAGGSFSCVLDAEGQATCWGEDGLRRMSSPPPNERFARLFAGSTTTCGIRTDDLGLTCWGSDTYGLLRPPEGKWSDGSIGIDHACALRVDGSLACWGRGNVGLEQVPQGVFRDVAVGRSTACAIDAGGALVCWGTALPPTVPQPTGDQFTQVAVGWDHACAIELTGALRCWGGNGYRHARDVPGRFLAVGVRAYETCGLRDDGDVVCFGEVERTTPLAGTSLSMAQGFHFCARTATNTLACGTSLPTGGFQGGFGEEVPPIANLTGLSVGERMTCGLDAAGLARCFGVWADVGRPEVPLTMVRTGSDLACGLRRDDGRTVCWGWTEDTELDPAPDLPFVDVAVGNGQACGLDAAGEATCWGLLADTPAPGPFQAIHAADTYACGHRVDGKVACWGTGDVRIDAPNERFLAIDLDMLHACGLRPDRSVTCWGLGRVPPDDAGPWMDVSVAQGNACGLSRAGAPTCWGASSVGSVDPPPVRDLVDLEGGWEHQCGLDASGGTWCWGSLARRPFAGPLTSP